MRTIILTATTVIAIGLVNPSSSVAQSRQSVQDLFNKCVELARQRGYSNSDLDGNRAAARNFVIRCMQGRQR